MLPRALRLISLPMLALLLAIPAHAHAALIDVDDASTNCGSNEDHDSADQRQAPIFAPLPADDNSLSRFSAVRPVPANADAHPGTIAAHIAVCRASLHLIPSPDAAAHLTLELSKPLPAGALAAHLVRRFAFTTSGAHPGLQLEIDAPPGTSPRVELALPLGTSTELALVQGNLELTRLLGNAQIAIVKGNATLHLADSDFKTLECATIMGGIRDRRPGGSSHGHMLSTWTTNGTGTAKIEISAVSGDLILLPPVN